MRKRLALAAAFLGVVAGLAVVLGTGIAAADNGNGAVVNRDPYGNPWTCNVRDTTGDVWFFDCTIQQVITPDGTVNEYLKGPITSGSAAPDKARHDVTTAETGLLCDFVNGGFTSIVQGTVTPSGQVNLTCR
jgi:hypothetical protein